MSNHLGNVLSVVSDKLIPVDDDTDGTTDRYLSEILSAMDYSPFGVVLEDRDFSSSSYRNGFNGMERDDEVKGSGNSYDFGARLYDSRLGRWLSVDPRYYGYPELSPYNFTKNSALQFIDPDGRKIKRVKANYKITDVVDYYDGEGNPVYKVEITKVEVSELSAQTEKALNEVMKTPEGFAYFSRFMKKGEKIGDYTATEDGDLSDATLVIEEASGDGFTSFGRTGDLTAAAQNLPNGVTPKIFNVKMEAEVNGNARIKQLEKSPGNPLNIQLELTISVCPTCIAEKENVDAVMHTAVTIGHEIFIHADKFTKVFESWKKGDYRTFVDQIKSMHDITTEKEHDEYKNGSNSKMNSFTKSLTKSGGRKAEKAVKEHNKNVKGN